MVVAGLHGKQRVGGEPAADQLRSIHVRHSPAQVPSTADSSLRHRHDRHRLGRLGAALDAVDRRMALHRRTLHRYR